VTSSTKPRMTENNEYANFQNALKKVLSVSHAQIKSELDREKRRKSRTPSASREKR
jgi:hypothetical protein